MLANDQEPILDADTITSLLERSLAVDKNGRYPGMTDYETTYDLHAAAARGWRMKASIVAASYDLNVDGKGLTRSQMIDQFLRMAREHARQRGITSRHLGREARLWHLPCC